MPRLRTLDADAATGEVKELLNEVQARVGSTPNLARTMAHSPAALQAYLDSSAALNRGTLPIRLCQQIALIVAEINACRYCLAAHTAIGMSVGLSDEAILDSRRGESPNSQEAAVLQFARKLVMERGHVNDDDLSRLRRAGYGDGEMVEIAAHVAQNIFTNYLTLMAKTEVDFP